MVSIRILIPDLFLFFIFIWIRILFPDPNSYSGNEPKPTESVVAGPAMSPEKKSELDLPRTRLIFVTVSTVLCSLARA